MIFRVTVMYSTASAVQLVVTVSLKTFPANNNNSYNSTVKLLRITLQPHLPVNPTVSQPMHAMQVMKKHTQKTHTNK